MDRRAWRGRGPLLGAVAAYVVAAGAAIAALLWASLAPEHRDALRAGVRAQAGALALLTGLGLAGLILLVSAFLGRYATTARRIAADTRLLLGANPDHRLDTSGPAELSELAAVVNELAERRRIAEREVDRQVSAARADVEAERNRLAALMAQLSVAVLVCDVGGRILLYNTAARSLLDNDPAVGLGRSVFGVVDRGLITHALEQMRVGSAPAHVATAVRGPRLLQVRVAPVRGPDGVLTGLLLVLDDLTERLGTSQRRETLLRELTEVTRASLASIRAAIETVVDYPDMEPEERGQFVEIVREESRRLGTRIEKWAAESTAHAGYEWLLTDVRGSDLLTVLARELERENRENTLSVSVDPGADEVWVKADSHALARAVVHLAARLRQRGDVGVFTLSLTGAGGRAQLDLRWDGRGPDAATFTAWLDEPLPGSAAASVREVVERHAGEAWSGDAPDGSAYARVLLPLAEAARQPAAAALPDVGSRPEFYDLALFDLPEQTAPEWAAWQDRKLADLSYTVFDTETTGLDPAGGDRIISIGAVRVVNGRLLRQESFEQLIDPDRHVPAASVAVHGITTEMLRGQPTIDQALPRFARYAEDTVLVGHNVGFDMRFLELEQERTGIRFTQPVLDTLLLDAAVHPDYDEHSLEAIAARLGVDVVGRHTALGDALVTGEVFTGLLALLERRGIHTLGQALAAARATAQARLDSSLYGD